MTQPGKPIIQTYRYGTPRGRDELLRLGAARQLPRGVKKTEYQKRGYFDVWMPLLAPSPELVAAYRHGKIPWETFASRYKKEMQRPEPRHVISLVAAMLPFCPVSLGCFCEDESHCHRSLLAKLVEAEAKARGAAFAAEAGVETLEEFASPVCYAAALEHARPKKKE